MAIITFEPIYQERVWGGRNIEACLDRSLPKDATIGESWDIVDRADNQSIILDGEWKGLSLRQAIETHGDKIMGPDWPKQKPFPVLVKWLDCQERLSLQVHPPAAAANRLKGEPKTEHWYVAQATQNAALLVGLKHEVSRDEFETQLNNDNLEALVHRVPSQAGDAIFVPSGRLHAIDGGNLILEIQQNSDTTYRVYDWGRVGLDGKPRDLHVEASLDCIDFKDIKPDLLHTTSAKEMVLADCHAFRIRKLHLKAGETFSSNAQSEPLIVSVIEGVIRDNSGSLLKKGVNGLIPFEESCVLEAQDDSSILLTDRFATP